MRVRRRAVVSGRVQGVFFRDSCRRQALAEGVDGWVRNRRDGGVEACFEGEADAVERMVEWAVAGRRARSSRALTSATRRRRASGASASG